MQGTSEYSDVDEGMFDRCCIEARPYGDQYCDYYLQRRPMSSRQNYVPVRLGMSRGLGGHSQISTLFNKKSTGRVSLGYTVISPLNPYKGHFFPGLLVSPAVWSISMGAPVLGRRKGN